MPSSIDLLYAKDAGVWIPNSETVWEGAVVTRSYKQNDPVILLTSESGELIEVKVKDEKDLPPLRNPEILIGQNDLTALSYLNEPDVLSCLEVRFVDRQAIYTYCGIVLVAINPYYDLPLYGPDIIRAYRGHSMGELEPHIFAVAEEAYAKLEREKCDISIVVSGESGAGKTVSAKYAMRYFAAVGGSENETQIEKKVLASSPIMEAIGNAKTTRNDNSSRFGKFTKLIFVNDVSQIMSLTGGTMQTYLLEKSRVVFQTADERNYHIFYQLCAARKEWPELMLDHPDKFHFLNQGQAPEIDKVSDLEQFEETVNACRILGFSAEDINDIMRTLAGVLHLGNINFTHKYKKNSSELDNEGCDIKDNDLYLNVLSDILKVNKQELRKWLVHKQIESGHECLLIPITKVVAEAARDALAKHIYAKLFQYIVEKINKNLLSSKKQHNFIGVLDIYGFETFDINSFEQFCINYANEKLQQQFNQHVFKLEQEEYLKEGIVWTMIDFYDNQPCIDLIESKLGILDLLDEECRMPKGSDESWTGKLFEKCSKYKHFDKPRFGAIAFIVNHFSDTVRYESQGFLEKNRDNVSKELVNTIRMSGMSFLKKIIDLEEGTGKPLKPEPTTPGIKTVVSVGKTGTSGRQQKKTVGSQFRDSLNLLITTLHATTPHYVRCIKPNETKTAFDWEPRKIIQQLRACGVLETIRISAAGFPSRWIYEDFYSRYRLLCKRKQIVEWNVKATCKNIVRNWLQDDDKYRLGNTQLFFRAGQVAFLEQLRSDIRKKHIIFVQALIRRFIYCKKYLRLKRVALGLQARCRGLLARKRAQLTRETRAAITIQRYTRGWLCRSRYRKLHHSVLRIQTYARGLLARRTFRIALDNFKITEVQRVCRGYLVRLWFKEKQKKIVLAQSIVRRFLARRLFKKLRAEARTISHIQKMYKGLENKIIELQQKIDNLNKENNLLKTQTSEMSELKIKLEAMKNMENELKSQKRVLKEMETNYTTLTKQFEQERDEKMTLLDQKVKGEEKWKHEKETLENENLNLKKILNEMEETVKKDDQTTRSRLLSEVDSNELHYAYQKTVKDKDLLESENNTLKKELQRYKNLIMHQHDVNSLSPRNSVSPSLVDDDGYSSAKNTLQNRRKSMTVEAFASPKDNVNQHDSTSIIIKLRKLLEEEKNKGELLRKEIQRRCNVKNGAFNTEDSLRLSEMELENEKLREDYLLLRNSIKRGVEHQELEAQYNAVLEELMRRREECIQLKAVLSQQSQSIKLLGQQTLPKRDSDRHNDDTDLQEAFSAQKLVNRQLESELTALTQENNARLEELSIQLDNVRREKMILQEILQEKLDNTDDNDMETLKQNENYLRYEFEVSTATYVELQFQMNELTKKFNELMKKNMILSNRLRDNGLNSEAEIQPEHTNIAMVKKKAQNIQGILKYRYEDEEKILQRLIHDLKPRVAITLLPGLPAYIVFMCIRYTDMVNMDQHVRTLLSNFVISVKKMFKLPNATECRILWLVNTLTLHNLLKQYGGIEDYTKFNTELQNQQQLKNFDLSEYRQVIHETIINIYGIVVRQVQDLIKPFIVPAILDHDEMERGRSHGKPSRTMSLDISPDERKPKGEPSSLVNQLEHYYKQFSYFGLEECYIEQMFKQLMYYICAVSLNNLMLRQDLCTWKTGMKIRYNVSCLEDWIRRKKLSNDVLASLLPLIQVSSLLQSRKTEEDVQSICDISTSLTAATVLKIIKSYKWDDCENPIKPIFIEKLRKHLQERSNHQRGGNDVFTMEENFVNPLIVVYKFSDAKLDEIDIPQCLNLSGLVIKI